MWTEKQCDKDPSSMFYLMTYFKVGIKNHIKASLKGWNNVWMFNFWDKIFWAKKWKENIQNKGPYFAIYALLLRKHYWKLGKLTL